MFFIDSNVWIAQVFSVHPGHGLATRALSQASSDRPAVFCRATQQSFLRVASTPAVLQHYGASGMTNNDALRLLTQFLDLPAVAFHQEPANLVPLWHRLASRGTASPKVWMDAYLAAFAIAGNLTMISLDSDMKQFEYAGLNLQSLQIA